ncbi:MAG: NAD(P)-dependent oxidoreductase [Candidatus Accumulibacter sp.]|uniref:NAD-dependent epimerase/dehydratase family protein n=1 Tax=Accumulibacter sp. TaxID=2053492 RepID=UPI001AC655B9|nr:NAD(P)-dependent oxidoreductase [Accumulibacter sp.]MBN8517270.1 NAD(P)-dependent oxidoreductase [Accumulibacter sp.]MBO3712565.1 NAD(P)-dependent oxidoreductase [Accumulibacter sp.]
MTRLPPIAAEDREHILRHTANLWEELAGTRFFITGGTGFFGKWLLESFAAANDQLGAQVRATVLSRNPARFAAEVPHLALRPEFDWLIGETDSFPFPHEKFDYVIHLATPSAAEISAGDAALALSVLHGMHRVLEFARQSGIRRLLLSSSGAVYGRQPASLSHIPEDYNGAPDPGQPLSAYGELKRMAELMCTLTPEVECVITRGFSFVGPYLPLSDKFAAGSFLRDALEDKPVVVRGNGTAQRSYLYASDMAIWLLTILARGKSWRAYNVGSNEAVSTLQLAQRIALCSPTPLEVKVLESKGNSAVDTYLPDISLAHRELGLRVAIDLDHALKKTFAALSADPLHATCAEAEGPSA